MSALRSATAARGLRHRSLSTKTQAVEQEALRKATAHVGRELQKMRGEMVSHAKLQRALLVVAYLVVAYLGFSIYSQTCETERLAKKVEALNANVA